MLAQPSGFRPELPDLFYQNNIKGWGPPPCARRPDVTMTCMTFTNMYTKRADFVFTVTRDFVRACQTPILVLPDDVPAHLYAVAMETVRLAPKAEVSIYPWKASKDQIPQGGAPGARLPPGASPRDRCPLRPAVWRRSAASRFPQARGRIIRDWGQRTGAWRARIAWLEDAAITVTTREGASPEEGLWVALKDDAHTVSVTAMSTRHPAWSAAIADSMR